MKFLEIDALEIINEVLCWENGEASITGRVEAYSCKSAGTDKKLFKQLEHRYDTMVSPPEDDLIVSPFGKLSESAPRKTFFYLLATLNAAYPEHDFSDTKPEQFVKERSVELVVNSINTTLFNLGNEYMVNKYRLWETIDELIDFADCDVYNYQPELDDDPNADEEGYIWSTNYFFFSRKLKRMVFFSLKSSSIHAPVKEDEDEDDNDIVREDDDEFDITMDE